MTFPKASLDLARQLLGACERRGWHLATAESCTGGLIIACLTEIPGSSSVVARGYVTYDNRAKAEMLGVPAALFERVGAVSEEVARAMAEGALARADVELAIAVTGIAGPGGATPTKPVGLVHLAVAQRGVRPGTPASCSRATAPRSASPASMPRSRLLFRRSASEVELSDDRRGDRFRRAGDVDRDRVARRLERGELAVQQGRRHVVPRRRSSRSRISALSPWRCTKRTPGRSLASTSR